MRILLVTLSIIASFAAASGCKLPNDESNDKPVPPIATDACEPWDCGALPNDADQTLCPDGETLAGPTGECIAHGSECAWKVVSCPETPECEIDDCGERPAQGNYLCTDDRTMAGPTGRCLLKAGTCQWEIKKCPAGKDLCAESQCGPSPALPNWLCADGETVAGPTGTCLKKSNGTCQWEVIECSDLN